jgi:hypothetical protein
LHNIYKAREKNKKQESFKKLDRSFKGVFSGLISGENQSEINNSWTPFGSCFGSDFFIQRDTKNATITLVSQSPLFGCTDFSNRQLTIFNEKLNKDNCEIVKKGNGYMVQLKVNKEQSTFNINS